MLKCCVLKYVCVCVCVCVLKCCNSIIFMIKHILYLSRTVGAVPSVVKVQNSLMEYRDEENKIASKGGKIGIHLLKWEC